MNPCQDPTYLRLILLIKEMLNIICIVIPIILIVVLIIRISKLVINGGENHTHELKIMVSKIISAMCIFFVPMFVNIAMSLVDQARVQEGSCWKNANKITIAKYQVIEEAEKELEKAQKALERAKISEENKRIEEARQEELKKKLDKIRSNNSISGSGGESDCKGSYKGPKYNLTEDEIIQLSRMVYGEYSADENGMRAVASHMANLYEIRQYLGYGKGKSLFTYITTCGWYATAKIRHSSKYDNSLAREVTEDVLVNGNRSLPPYVDEFDMFPGDVLYASSINDYKSYQPWVTKIRGRWDGSGVYYCTTSSGRDANLYYVTENGKQYKKAKGY